MEKKKIWLSMAIGIIMAFAVSVGGFAKECGNIRQDILRLHVIANSDSDSDQQLKLKVRDAVLKEGKNIFDGSVNVENATEKIGKEKEKLISAAEKTVKENGFDYKVDVYVTNEFFPTRSYGKLTIPAGRYEAVKVTIGQAEGHNWWCVMFPPLCLPAAGESDVDMYLDEDESRVIKQDTKYDFRFKIVEWYESIRDRYF